ncbi:unnamed protein product [Pleuronectes platessa]|uniref:Uncharacterized protein n=1 Tax=Pleuronectes platessa TaxID=8262 RepID=A0A9N7YY59_PLEPL|nr:unnamed protein product [Pleuronectes platessa]
MGREREHPSHFKYYLRASGLMERRASMNAPVIHLLSGPERCWSRPGGIRVAAAGFSIMMMFQPSDLMVPAALELTGSCVFHVAQCECRRLPVTRALGCSSAEEEEAAAHV